MRVAFVYPNPRGDLARAWRRGEAPDSPLLGQNHLHEHGIDAYVHDPGLARAGDGRVDERDVPEHRPRPVGLQAGVLASGVAEVVEDDLLLLAAGHRQESAVG